MLEPKKGANFKLFKTVCLNGSTAEIMTSGWADVAEQISYTHTKTRETDSDNTSKIISPKNNHLNCLFVSLSVVTSNWKNLKQKYSKNITNDITFQKKIYHQVRKCHNFSSW